MSPTAREINASIRYTMWSVFALRDPLGDLDRAPVAAEVEALVERLRRQGRGGARAPTTCPGCGPTPT